MTTHLTGPKQVVDAYMAGVPDEQFRAETLYKDWDGWEGAAKQVIGCLPRGYAIGDMRDGSHAVSQDGVARVLEERYG